jgi:hypothetical protein
MLGWALTFLVIALIAGAFGFGGIKRFAKNPDHRFSRNAVLCSIVARVPPSADTSG